MDYLAEVWLNGVYAGGHEGGESPFTLDITDIIEQKSENLLVVRVLNPTNEPIDGIILKQTPHRNKVEPYVTGGSYNHGGIVQPVELIYAPAARVTDVFARPDIASGRIQLQTTVRNDTAAAITASLEASVTPASGGSIMGSISYTQNFPQGDSIHNIELHIPGRTCGTWMIHISTVSVSGWQLTKQAMSNQYAVDSGISASMMATSGSTIVAFIFDLHIQETITRLVCNCLMIWNC